MKRHRVGKGPKKYRTSAEKLSERLKKDWLHVGFDPETQAGSARVGSLGEITFRESGSDPAVIVSIKPPTFKTTDEHAMKIINALHDIYAGL
jgi:hypothetical protein